MALRTSFSLHSPTSRHPPSLPRVRLAAVSSLSLPVSSPRLRSLSLSTTATASFASSSVSAAPPLTFQSRHNIQLPDEQFETAGAGWDGGFSGGGSVGDHDGDSNRKKLLMVPPRADWPPENPPADSDGSERFFELEKSPLLGRLLRRIKEGMLADDVFLAKLADGMLAETAAVYKQNFFKGLENVFADVVMAIIADFMISQLPMRTASLAPALANIAGPIAQLFHGCPDGAFQNALPGASYSLALRVGALALNGAKLFAVGTASSMVRMGVRNALINARKVVEKSSGGEVEKVPILSTSLAYGVYMAISSNLRSQVLDGVIEQRIVEPLLHQHKLMLSATCFAVRMGNAILGSLLWIDYARWIGIQ